MLGIIVISVTILSAPQTVNAFKPQYHKALSAEALLHVSRTIDGQTLIFTAQAISEIQKADADTDNASGLMQPSYHFDDEQFVASSSRLIVMKSDVIEQITFAHPNGAIARRLLGGGLHTLQDFYAHTNWVELGNTGIDTRLGNTIIPNPAPNYQTSPLNDPGTLLPNITQLTSGYFSLSSPCTAPPGKTRHGNDFILNRFAHIGYCPSGLNKDEPDRPGFQAAYTLALAASIDYVNQILDAPGVAGNIHATKALMGIPDIPTKTPPPPPPPTKTPTPTPTPPPSGSLTVEFTSKVCVDSLGGAKYDYYVTFTAIAQTNLPTTPPIEWFVSWQFNNGAGSGPAINGYVEPQTGNVSITTPHGGLNTGTELQPQSVTYTAYAEINLNGITVTSNTVTQSFSCP
jgi:hypothetical protein